MTDAELTRLAADKVMGFADLNGQSDKSRYPRFFKTDGGISVIYDPAANGIPWSPLTDWRAAGEILEKMRADGMCATVHIQPETVALVEVNRLSRSGYECLAMSDHKSGPRAITLAALIAVAAITEDQL